MKCPACEGTQFAVDFETKKAKCMTDGCDNVVWLTAEQSAGAAVLASVGGPAPEDLLYGIQPGESPAYGQPAPDTCPTCGPKCARCAEVRKANKVLMAETRPGQFKCQHCGAESRRRGAS